MKCLFHLVIELAYFLTLVYTPPVIGKDLTNVQNLQKKHQALMVSDKIPLH